MWPDRSLVERASEMHGTRLLGELCLSIRLCVAGLEALWCLEAAACSLSEVHSLVGCCCSYTEMGGCAAGHVSLAAVWHLHLKQLETGGAARNLGPGGSLMWVLV